MNTKAGPIIQWLAKAGPVGSLYQGVRGQIETSHDDHQLEGGHVSTDTVGICWTYKELNWT